MNPQLQKVLPVSTFCLALLISMNAFANRVVNSSQPSVVFTENKGQITDQSGAIRSDVLYMGSHGESQYIITGQGVSHQLHTVSGEQENQSVSFQRIDMQWLGSSFKGEKTGYRPTEGINNFYGAGSAVVEGVQSFEEARLFGVYPGIDVRFYSIGGLLEYDFELAPNVDWRQIQIRITGATPRINAKGELEMPTAMGVITESAPRVFQEGKKLDSKWVMINSNTVGFEIFNATKGKAITIDPVVLIWSNQLGGSGNETADAVATDGSGNVIIAGNTNSVRNIATTGSHQSVIGGLQDAFIAKFDANGRRLWTTYYGSLGNESGQSCSVDGLGNVYLAGQAGGAAPNSIASSGAYQVTNASGSFDLYLAKFNANGLRQWATYYGGPGVENYADCATDVSGNVFLAGITSSTSGIATAGAHQTSLGGSTDGFVVKFSGSGSRLWATYHGGSLDEGSQISCATDVNGNLALAGETRSTNNIATSGAYQQSLAGNFDAWCARFTTNGARTWSTYLGGTANDRCRSVAIDGNGNVVIAGWTSSTSAIATSGAFQTTYGGGASDAFITSFQQNGAINWSTYKGGTSNEQGYALAVENSGNIMVLTSGPTALEAFASNGTYLSNSTYTGPFYGALLNICSGGNGIVLASGQANNNALVEKYQVGAVMGIAFNDTNQNCQQDAGESAVPNMRFMIQPGNYFVQSDNAGRLSVVALANGSYTIYPDTLQSPWSSTCGNAVAFQVINGIGTIPPLGLIPKSACSAPEVTVFASTLRACVNNQKIRVSACNKSTATVNLVSAFVDITFDPNIVPLSAPVSFFPLGGSQYRFIVGDVTPGNCIDFNVTVDVGCNVVTGQSLCMEAKLFPADSCAIVGAIYPGTSNGLNLYGGGIPCTAPWDTSALSVKGVCQGGTVFFDVVNTAGSNGNMACFSQVRIFTDGVLTQIDSVQLLGGEVKSYVLPANGQTMRLEVDQHPLAPFYNSPSVTIELCGGNTSWTPGLVNSLPDNDASPAVDIFCAVADEFIPNFSKRGFPNGVGSSHLIYPNRQLQYFIEFTNTSNDTVYNVIVRDTLDVSLNPFTVVAGGASHPYQFRMYGNSILEWRFNNINLPPASSSDPKGYLSFTVEQNPDLPDNTVINNIAYASLNLGSFTQTNATFHTVNRQLFNVQSCPPPTITGIAAICQGASTTLTASGGYQSYAWSTGASSQSIVVSTAGTYTVTVVDANGCTSSASRTVVVNNNPTPLITGNFNVCFGSSVNLDAGPGYATYLWSTGATTQSISSTTSGTFTVTVSNIAGCTGTASQTATVNPKPTPVITGIFNVCQGAAATLTAQSGFSSYLWSTGSTNVTINPTVSGTYTVTVTNAFGCSGVSSQSVTVNATPAPSISGNAVICQGQTATLTASSGFVSYLWSNGATTASIAVITAGTYTVTVTDSIGCVGTKSQVVTVNTNPVPTITGVSTACQGSAATLTASAGFNAYLWSNGQTTQSINPTVSGTYTVTVTNAAGCTGSVSRTVTIVPNPTPTITGVFGVCQGNAATLTASGGFTSYLWSNGAVTQTINPTSAGVYTVTVTNASGCTGSASQTVTVGSAISTTVNANACPGTSYLLPNGQSVTAAGTYVTTLTASNGCDSTITTNLTFIDNQAPVLSNCPAAFTSCNPVSWVAPSFTDNCSFTVSSNFQPGSNLPLGNNTVTYTATDAGGNVTSCSFVVTVVDFSISFNQTNVSCNGGSNGSATAVVAGSQGIVTYQWNTGATTATINNLSAGNYTVTVTNGTCSRQSTVTITQPAVFTAAITPNGPTVFCQGGSVTLTATAGASYVWNTGASTQSIVVANSGNYVVTVTNAAGCTAVASGVSVTVNPTVTASVSITSNPSGSITANTNVVFTATAINGGSTPSYQWRKNGVVVGTNSSTYSNNAWANGDVVTCVMTSNANCVTGSPATSNGITIQVTLVAGAPRYVVSDIVDNAVYYYDSSFVFISSSPLSTATLNGNTNAADVHMTASNGYVVDGVNVGRVYRTTQAGSTSTSSRNLRSNTGAALKPSTGVITVADTLYVLDKQGRALYPYLLSQAFSGTTNLNAFAKKNLATQNSTAEAVATDGSFFYVLDNGATKTIFRYPIGATGTIVRSRAMQKTSGVSLGNSLGLVVDGTRVWVVDNTADTVYAFDKTALFTGSNTIPLVATNARNLASNNLDATGIALVTNINLLRAEPTNVIDNESIVSIWPNPNSGMFNLSVNGFQPDQSLVIRIFDLRGKLVFHREVDSIQGLEQMSFDIGRHAPGVYAVVIDQGAIRKSTRMVVE